MKLVSLDFETYYAPDYTLSKLTTEEYIRDPRFEVIGVGIKLEDGPAVFFPQPHVAQGLETIDWANSMIVAHNMIFDGAILGWKYGKFPKAYADTLSMARGLGLQAQVGGSLAKLIAWAQNRGYPSKSKGNEVVQALGKRYKDFSFEQLKEYGDYCKNDVEGTDQLFKVFMDERRFPVSELRVIDETMRLYCDPLLQLDKPLLKQHLQRVIERKDLLMHRVGVTLEDIRSDKKFAALLEARFVEVPYKVSPATGNPTFAFSKTDQAFLELREHADEEVQALVECRLGNKSTIEESRTKRFIGIAERGSLPVPLKYYAAHTGRFGGTDKINLQNLPRGGVIRDTMTAPAGHLLVVADSAQIEARMVAWLAQEDMLVSAFKNNEDVYSSFASEVFGVPVTKQDKERRFVGKTCVAQGTMVLSSIGWKPIESIALSDLLWDGENFVCHSGLIHNGCKPTLSLCGALLTADHLVLCGGDWKQAGLVVQNEYMLSQALARGAENLPSLGILKGNEVGSEHCSLHALVGGRNIPLTTKSWKHVYDIANVGPNNRFTILTERGPLLVHNCILGLGYGMGGEKFQGTLKRGQGGVRFEMDIKDAKGVVSLYRGKYRNIHALWKQGNAALEALTLGDAAQFGLQGVVQLLPPDDFEAVPRVLLPNGMAIRYSGLVQYQSDKGKQFAYEVKEGKRSYMTRLYGGKLTENVVQALARIVITDQWIKIKNRAIKERIFYRSPVVGQVHDELIACVPEAAAQDMQALMIEEMHRAPSWAAGLPVACEAGIGKRYGDAK
jgi:DNA polymerase I-like protein with 3'-5' exonuclease and polymerase domains